MPLDHKELIPKTHHEFAYTQYLADKTKVHEQIRANLEHINVMYKQVGSLYKMLDVIQERHIKDLELGVQGEEMSYPDLLEKEPKV
jgi:hypothetical protein